LFDHRLIPWGKAFVVLQSVVIMARGAERATNAAAESARLTNASQVCSVLLCESYAQNDFSQNDVMHACTGLMSIVMLLALPVLNTWSKFASASHPLGIRRCHS
jgi:hypothetical protein